MKDIKEEIERIKKLFTEERLYGNLINETCNDEVDAARFLRDNGYYVEKKDNADPKSIGGLCFQSPKMKKIQKYLRTKLSNYNTLNPSISSDSGVCYLRLLSSAPTATSENGKISKAVFWVDDIITFYYLLPKPVDFTSVDTLTGGTMPNINTVSNPLITTISMFGDMMTTNKIASIRYECRYSNRDILTASPTYSELKFAGFYDENYKRTAKPVEKQIIKNWVYNCCDGSQVANTKSSDANINQMALGSEYLNLSGSGPIVDIVNKIA